MPIKMIMTIKNDYDEDDNVGTVMNTCDSLTTGTCPSSNTSVYRRSGGAGGGAVGAGDSTELEALGAEIKG